MSEEKRMEDRVTGIECNEENAEWDIASSSSATPSSTANKTKYVDQPDAVNCATAIHIDSDMTMKEIQSKGDVRDECPNNVIVTTHTGHTVNSARGNLETMDQDPIDANSSSLSSLSLIHSNSTVNENAAADIHNASTNSQVLVTSQVASTIVDNLLNRQAEIREGNSPLHNGLVREQGGDEDTNNVQTIDFSNVNVNVMTMNESMMEHDQIGGNETENETGVVESQSDKRQMPNMNNLAEALTLSSARLVAPMSTNRLNENDCNESDVSNRFASTPFEVVNGSDSIDYDILRDLATSSSNSSYNQSHETILSSTNQLNSTGGLHNNVSTVEEEEMMIAAGIQSNYPLVLVRRLSQTELNQTQSNAAASLTDLTERDERDVITVGGRGRPGGQGDSLELELASAVAEQSEIVGGRQDFGSTEVAAGASIALRRENSLRSTEGEDNEVDNDDDEEMNDGDATPVYASDGVSSSSVVGNDALDDNDIDDDVDDDESESSQNAVGRAMNNGNNGRTVSRTHNAYDIEYDSLRELIVRTRRSMNEEAASSSSSSMSNFELAPRDSFMQRFRRILFILSSRRRRLIRLGLASPDNENPDGESGAGAGAAADAGSDADAELDPNNSSIALHQIAHRLSLDFDVDLNDLEQDQGGLLLAPGELNGIAEGARAEAGGTSAAQPDVLPDNAIRFDTNLPAEHSYMGNNMNRVCGVNYLDVGQQYNNIMLFMHHALLFPGEILPFMISGSLISDDINRQNGFLFGVCFPFLTDSANNDNIYGVTCQIYEKGTDDRGNTLIKSRALQRFVTKTNEFLGPLEYISDHPQMKCYGIVEILPDIYLPEPLKCITMGSLSRFRDIESMQHVYKRYQVAGSPWPAHIYEYYGISAIIEKARTQLAQHKIDTMPTDPIQLSYWLVRNLHLSESLMHSIFLTNSVNVRFELISRTFKEESIFSCRYCSSHIANCRELFAMSKHGIQTQYCNSAGYIHETNTLYQVNMDAILYSGTPSTEFSWFPGYQWHVIVCKICKHHLGWEFRAVKPNLVPKQFYGISSSGIRTRSAQSVRDDARIRSIIRFHSARAMILEEAGSGSDSGSGGANADATARAAIDNNNDNNAMQLDDDIDANAGADSDDAIDGDGGGGVGGSRDGRLPSLD